MVPANAPAEYLRGAFGILNAPAEHLEFLMLRSGASAAYMETFTLP